MKKASKQHEVTSALWKRRGDIWVFTIENGNGRLFFPVLEEVPSQPSAGVCAWLTAAVLAVVALLWTIRLVGR